MAKVLTIDFGSTYTKVSVIDTVKDEVVATAKSFTTIETSVVEGLEKAIAQLGLPSDYKFDHKLACSSAAGGLKIVAIGLVESLTAEAARRAALGAGARIIGTYANKINRLDIDEIKASSVDIILLAGGTDGGNSDVVLANANKLAEANIGVPIIYSGNRSCLDEIEDIFNKHNIDYYVSENVMPALNKLNEVPARNKIREVFMNSIIHSKGIDKAASMVDGEIIPTPSAVLNAGEILATGSNKEQGLGDLVIVDIGGATTDIHSLAKGLPTKPHINFQGLEESYSKRTVEGDLGMRYSALSLYHALPEREFKKHIINDQEFNIEEECKKRSTNVSMIPTSKEEIAFDTAMARVAVDLSFDRHVGYIVTTPSPFGEMFSQYGKDLTGVKTVIGTGGVIVHSDDFASILQACEFKQTDPTKLRPMKPNYLLDKTYILSAAGLLRQVDEDAAVRLLKKYLIS